MSIDVKSESDEDVASKLSEAVEKGAMLRDERGHRVGVIGDKVVCPVTEHEPKRVVDLVTATFVWERDDA